MTSGEADGLRDASDFAPRHGALGARCSATAPRRGPVNRIAEVEVYPAF